MVTEDPVDKHYKIRGAWLLLLRLYSSSYFHKKKPTPSYHLTKPEVTWSVLQAKCCKFVFFNSFTDHKLEFAFPFKELDFKWTTDCSEQAYFLELHGLDIKGFAQVNTGALVRSSHYESDDSNSNPSLSTSRIWTCWENKFLIPEKKGEPFTIKWWNTNLWAKSSRFWW